MTTEVKFIILLSRKEDMNYLTKADYAYEEIKKMGLEKRDAESFDISVGDLIRVISGAFESNLGTVEKIYPDKEKVQVMMQIFGRETPVELEFNQIEKVSSAN